jgi:hypothetical protein
MRRVALMVAMLAAAASACGSGNPKTPGGGSASPVASSRPRSTATLKILEPLPGTAITGGVAHVRLQLDGGQIVQQASTRLTADKGHVHLTVDGKLVSMTYGLEQDVPALPGRHLLQAEFVAMDHAPFNPRVIATTTFIAR